MREPDRHLKIATPDAMRALGARIARAIVGAGLQAPLMVGLCGDLGAVSFVAVSRKARRHPGGVRALYVAFYPVPDEHAFGGGDL